MSVVCLLPIYLYVTKSTATDTPISKAHAYPWPLEAIKKREYGVDGLRRQSNALLLIMSRIEQIIHVFGASPLVV